MYESDPAHSFDTRAFWITLAACVFTPLAFACLMALESVLDLGAGPIQDLIVSVLFAAWPLSFGIGFIWMIVSFYNEDTGRSLSILLGLLAAAIIGPGMCFGFFVFTY